MTNEHYYCIDGFYIILCMQIQELNNRFPTTIDKCDICMGSLNVLVSFIKINSRYFELCAYISPIMLGFNLFVFVIADLHISSQVLGEKHED